MSGSITQCNYKIVISQVVVDKVAEEATYILGMCMHINASHHGAFSGVLA